MALACLTVADASYRRLRDSTELARAGWTHRWDVLEQIGLNKSLIMSEVTTYYYNKDNKMLLSAVPDGLAADGPGRRVISFSLQLYVWLVAFKINRAESNKKNNEEPQSGRNLVCS